MTVALSVMKTPSTEADVLRRYLCTGVGMCGCLLSVVLDLCVTASHNRSSGRRHFAKLYHLGQSYGLGTHMWNIPAMNIVTTPLLKVR